MNHATCALLIAALAVAAIPAEAAAALPDGKIAVIRVTSVDGIASTDAKVSESRSTAFTFDGSTYTLDRSAVGPLDDIETLVLIDHREDRLSGEILKRNHSQIIRPVDGTYFEVTDVPDRVLAYQVAMIGGNLRLNGDGDQILCTGGANGPYHIWRVEGIDLVDRDAIAYR